MISLDSSGSTNSTEAYLKRMKEVDFEAVLERFGTQGVNALSAATPRDTGETANSWYYTVGKKNGDYFITWRNRHIENGAPIAIMLQYGYATKNNAYIPGRDYINPAIQPILNQISEAGWKVVTQ